MSAGDVLWLSFAFMLMFEGLMPLLAPQAWRRIMASLLQGSDGQLRTVGLLLVSAGLLLYWGVSMF